MKKKAVCLAVIILMLISSGAFSEDQYLCITEKSTGFNFDLKTKEWKQTNFTPSGKYILRRVTDEDRKNLKRINAATNWILSGFELNFITPCIGKSDDTLIHCTLLWDTRINLQSLRFVRISISDLLDRPADIKGNSENPGGGPDSASMKFGGCSSF